MQKIDSDLLDKMLYAKLSNREIDVLLYIARYQDETGKITGAYYKDVCENVGLSYQGYYDTLRALEQKGIIASKKLSYFDRDITILNNDFSGKDNFGKGYVSLHCAMVRSQAWKKLKGGAKLMALKLMREWKIYKKKTGSDSYEISKEKFYEKFKCMGLKKRTITHYLYSLSEFLSVYLKDDKMFYLTFKIDAVREASYSENEELREHAITTAARRNRIKEVIQEKKEEVNTILKQLNDDFVKRRFSLSEAVKITLEVANKDKKNKYKWERKFRPALIQQVIRELLGYKPPLFTSPVTE